MKKFITLILLACMAIAINAQRTFVLITGVSSYQNSQNNLKQTTKDAKNFYSVMKKHTNDVTILTSQYANRKNILEKLSNIARVAKPEDRIIFFFSGHGATGNICTYDEFINYNELKNILTMSAAKERLVFVDACHAGSAAQRSGDSNDDSWYKSGNNEIVFFVSSKAEETSIESPILGAGFFTQALIKGIRGMADYDNNRSITIFELFKFIYKDVKEHSADRQHPQLICPKSKYENVVLKW